MRAVTGIEIAADSCTLVRVRVSRALPGAATRAGRRVTLSRAHVIDSAQWPDHDVALAETLREVRHRARLPRRARVVGWALRQPAPLSDPATEAVLRPIRDAGFRVEAALTPPQALALLARQVTADEGAATPGSAIAWLALNRGGASIAIVRGRDLLYSRIFDWTYQSGSRAGDRLLQRYSFIAHLAPEVRHGIETVRADYAVDVERAIACGDLPDLRSVTMPLIEELDIEVETLDSTTGIEVAGGKHMPALLDQAPALRLACAAAAAPRARSAGRAVSLVRAAAALVGAGALGWWTYSLYAPLQRPRLQDRRAASTGQPRGGPGYDRRPPERGSRTASAVIPAVPPSGGLFATVPATGPAQGPAVQAPPPATLPAPPAAPTTRAPMARRPPARRSAGPSKEPLPAVNSILVSSDRRIAVLDGKIVEEGDTVGGRVLLRIEQDAVVLGDPSGREVRVSIRRKPAGGAGPEAAR